MASVHVPGATGMVGRALVARLAGGRNAAALAALPAAEPRLADLADAEATAHALADARRVVSCAYVRHVPTVLACLPGAVERVVVLGSARMWTRFADRLAAETRAAAAAFEAAPCPGFMLHPTLIYGPQAVSSIGRLSAWIAACPLLPLLAAAAFASRFLPGVPAVEAGIVRRLGEDRAFDIADMRACFGFGPMSLEAGLAGSLPVQASRALYSPHRPPGGGR